MKKKLVARGRGNTTYTRPSRGSWMLYTDVRDVKFAMTRRPWEGG